MPQWASKAPQAPDQHGSLSQPSVSRSPSLEPVCAQGTVAAGSCSRAQTGWRQRLARGPQKAKGGWGVQGCSRGSCSGRAPLPPPPSEHQRILVFPEFGVPVSFMLGSSLPSPGPNGENTESMIERARNPKKHKKSWIENHVLCHLASLPVGVWVTAFFPQGEPLVPNPGTWPTIGP